MFSRDLAARTLPKRAPRHAPGRNLTYYDGYLKKQSGRYFLEYKNPYIATPFRAWLVMPTRFALHGGGRANWEALLGKFLNVGGVLQGTVGAYSRSVIPYTVEVMPIPPVPAWP